ncbi:MAG: diguanylate cyclase [Desulfobacterales bacterium]
MRMQREALPLSITMCDVDCFKSYNDTYGHQNGDHCLRSIANALSQIAKRSVDRWPVTEGQGICHYHAEYGSLRALRVAESACTAKLLNSFRYPTRGPIVAPYITLSLGSLHRSCPVSGGG